MAIPNSDSSATTLSVRIPPEIREQLDELADATGRTKSFLAAQAIEQYVAAQAWQVSAIEKAVKKADGKKAKFVGHDKVSKWLKSWGTDKEQDMPK
jgi:predicted transcriptional regulator